MTRATEPSASALPSPAGDRRRADVRSEHWHFELADAQARIGLFVRLTLWPERRTAWWWTHVVRPGQPLVIVRDAEVPLPRSGLEIRTEGLWAALECEAPWVHWSVGMEAFGLTLDDPDDALGAERGDRVAVGLDLGWEVDGKAVIGSRAVAQPCTVAGELLLGAERIALDARGWRSRVWSETGQPESLAAEDVVIAGHIDARPFLVATPAPAQASAASPSGAVWPASVDVDGGRVAVEALGRAPVPVSDGVVLERALCRFDDGRGWGWAERTLRPDRNPTRRGQLG